mmetsp:Transcript_5623/g.25342  ORF Transcript_5623/g.25342 Transcript_5623/m.25342 type:complete len:241 (-) Transcript_5623:165-887(-)
MDEPRARVHLRQRRGVVAVLDGILEPVHVLHRGVPVLLKNVRGEFTPERASALLAVGAEAAVVVQELRGGGVVAALELELGVVEEGVDVLLADPVVLFEKVDVESLVGAELLDERGVAEEGDHLLGFGLKLRQVRDHLLPSLRHLRRHVLAVVQALVDVRGEIEHVRLLQQRDLRLEDLSLGVHLLGLEELEQREHQVAVQVLAELRRQVVLGRVGSHGVRSDRSATPLSNLYALKHDER